MELLILAIVIMVFAAVMSMMILSPLVAAGIFLWNLGRGISRLFKTTWAHTHKAH